DCLASQVQAPMVDEEIPVVTKGEVAREEHRALGWAAMIAVAAILWLVMPVGVGILLGAFLAFMVQPIFVRMSGRIGLPWAAVMTVMVSMLTVAGLFGGLAWLF